MSQLLCNIDSIISTFNSYAKSDGGCATLSKGQLKQLIQKEFAEVIVNPRDAETIGTIFQLLDTDCDGQVDFEEFTVLVFRVARACYKKEKACQAQVEVQPEESGNAECQSQGKRTPNRGSPRRSTQQPQIPGRSDCRATEESQASSQVSKPSQLETGGHSREPVNRTQEPTRQTSGSDPAVSQTEEDQQAGREQSRELTSGAQITEQDRSQQSSQEPPSCRRVVEPQILEEDSAQVRQASQQDVAEKISQQPQGQTQNLTGQQELNPQTPRQLSPTQQCTQEKGQHSSRGQMEEVQRREQEVTVPESQEGPSCGQVREPQWSEQGESRQSIQESQVERISPELQQEETQACPEQHRQEQNSHAEERTTCQQETLMQEEGPTQEGCSPQQSTAQQASRPPRQQEHERQTPERETAQQLTQNPQVPEQTPTDPRENEQLRRGRGPACRSEEASLERRAVSPQQPTPAGQRAEQVSAGRLGRGTRVEREFPTGQQECRPSQGLETNRAGQRERAPLSPQQARTCGQEREYSVTEQPREAQPARSHQDRRGRPVPGESKPQTTKISQSSGSTEPPPAQGPREASTRQAPLSSQQAQRPSQ